MEPIVLLVKYLKCMYYYPNFHRIFVALEIGRGVYFNGGGVGGELDAQCWSGTVVNVSHTL